MAAVWTAAALVAVGGSVALGQTPTVQRAPADFRWQAWAGCWVPGRATSSGMLGVPGTPGAPELCVRPVAGTAAIDIETIVEHRVVNTARIDADGARHPVDKNGCMGWESAEWNPSAARVYLRSEVACQGGPARSSTGIMAMTRFGEWMDVRGVANGAYSGVAVVRYIMVGDSSGVAGLPASGEAVQRLKEARWSAEAWVTTADVAEASHHVDVPVVQAWLAQLDQRLVVDGDRLRQLAAANVPPSVIDLVVALAYPQRFSVDRSTNHPEVRASDSVGVSADQYSYNPYYDDFGYYPYGFDPYGFGESRYGYAGSSPFGYNRYGQFYNGGYGGGTPPIIVVKPATPPAHVVNGRGYTQATSGNTGSGSNAGNAGPSASAPAPASSSSGGASSGGGGAAAAAPPRTAIPRPPGGTP